MIYNHPGAVNLKLMIRTLYFYKVSVIYTRRPSGARETDKVAVIVISSCESGAVTLTSYLSKL